MCCNCWGASQVQVTAHGNFLHNAESPMVHHYSNERVGAGSAAGSRAPAWVSDPNHE